MNNTLKILTGSVIFLTQACFTGLNAQDEDLLLTFRGHEGPVYSLAVHPEGNLIATGAEDRLILLWNPENGKIEKTLEGHGKPVKYLSFSKDGRFLLSAAATEVRVWDLVGGGFEKYTDRVTHVHNLDFNRDASRFLCTSLKPTFVEYDREAGEVARTFDKHTRTCLVAAYSPDNSLIASGSLDQTIKFWDAATGEVIRDISAHGGNIFSLDFSPDGRLLASASMDENIKLWEVGTGKIHKLLEGHEYAVVYVRFNPDGKYLISASYDRTAKLWELATGNCIYTFVDQKDALYCADFTALGGNIITCSNDGTVMIYRISPRFFAEYYYFFELQEDMRESGLSGDRRKGEKRDEYLARQEKAEALRRELHEKYYRMHLEQLENKPVQ